MTTVQVCRAGATVLALVVASLVTACGSNSSSAPPGPDSETSGPAPALVGVFGGDAELEGGCAWLDVGGQRWEVQYPTGYQVQFDPVRLLDPDGAEVARDGDVVEVAGEQVADAVTICQIGPVWRATAVTPR